MLMHTSNAIMFFCLGNICRSPIAHGLFAHLSSTHPQLRHWSVASSGTSSHHVGESPDPGSQHVARAHGIDLSMQRSQQLTPQDFEEFDYLVAMSRSNIANARRISSRHHERLLLIRDFEPGATPGILDVPDPWGRGPQAFEEVYTILERCMPNLITFLASSPAH